MDADSERGLTADASGAPAANPRGTFTSSAPNWDGEDREAADRDAPDLHPHPVPAFIAFVVARLIEARRPDVYD